jgi:hypothetical protein
MSKKKTCSDVRIYNVKVMIDLEIEAESEATAEDVAESVLSLVLPILEYPEKILDVSIDMTETEDLEGMLRESHDDEDRVRREIEAKGGKYRGPD